MFTLLSALSARTLSAVNFTDCHSYYRRRIEIKQHSSLRMVPVWMTLVIYNPDFKVTIIQRQVTRKWYNIELTMADQ